MHNQQETPYGMWESPFTTDLLLNKGPKTFGEVVIDGDRDEVYWSELRPKEGGRWVIIKRNADGTTQEITPKGYNVRTRVHEYGGGAYTVHDGIVYFVNFKDQRIYVQKEEKGTKNPQLLTKENVRFADLHVTEKGILAIAEKHYEEKGKEPENFLALIDVDTGHITPLATGYDFYASPSISPDGTQVAWLCWNHPNMPWDSTELWIANLHNKKLENAQLIAGGENISIFQPQWAPDGNLCYVSDEDGWWNLCREGENLFPLDADFGLPHWVFGQSTYAFVGDQILCTYRQDGSWFLAMLDPAIKTLRDIDLGGTAYAQVRTGKGFAALLKGSSTKANEVVKLDLNDLTHEVIGGNPDLGIDSEFFSVAEPISFPSANGRTAFGYYYPPTNKNTKGPKNKKPPLIIKSHGGPTSHSESVRDMKIQYWTSRGFAVLDVNYGGSTGYGREYRDLLKGQWGIIDVEDCEAGAQYLVDRGLADPTKLAIRGSSAGGYTTLAALTFGDLFTAGASHYGVSDLEALAKDTHKFESRYLDQLIGPYPEQKDLYEQRSPIHYAEQLSCPVIFFQGLEDKVVPPDQAEVMVNALRKKKTPCEYITYPDEQHGFRKAQTIKDTLEKELAFYRRVFKLGLGLGDSRD